ncbi:DUF4190 domain-containing protein [Actinocorallia sp. A-T 12471]|uniref:DUF4190 domain-containing protein n=1 Tax=Actinocorallia sp. A-T 12471 TaxID=3089813 RepID=UPI0029D3FFBA|nr:DUF4190 domain-containing protein [Actinocorallia sp. A-T 12471]MDX6738566.1 DUF4190 domain-containing protein [Actinocorallia sp. A-T 12471]
MGSPHPSRGPGCPSGPRSVPADAQTVPLAVVAVLSAVLCWPVGSVAGVLLGHLALHRIRRTGEPGRRFAVLGLVLGYAGLLGALAVGAFVALTTFGIPPQAG